MIHYNTIQIQKQEDIQVSTSMILLILNYQAVAHNFQHLTSFVIVSLMQGQSVESLTWRQMVWKDVNLQSYKMLIILLTRTLIFQMHQLVLNIHFCVPSSKNNIKCKMQLRSPLHNSSMDLTSVHNFFLYICNSSL